MGYASHIVFLTLLSLGLQHRAAQPNSDIKLNYREYWVSPRTTSEAFRIHVFNNTSTAITIEKAIPSCGCIMATIQKNRATKGEPGDIYVGIVSKAIDPLQPVTVDIYTSDNPTIPKRVYIRRAPAKTRL